MAAAAAETRGSDGAVSSAHLISGYLTAAEQLGDIHAKLADAAQQMEVAVTAMKRGWNAADDFQVLSWFTASLQISSIVVPL